MPPAERRAAIVDAARPLLREHGLSVTTRQIAMAAGVSEGTIFNVFADKDELISAVVERAIDPAPFEASIAAIDPDADFAARVIAATALIQRRTVDVWELISQVGPRHHPQHGPMPASPALTELLGTPPGRLRFPPDEAARMLRALTLSFTHPKMVATPHSPEAIVDIFLNGVGS